jgi:hypothetical protein
MKRVDELRTEQRDGYRKKFKFSGNKMYIISVLLVLILFVIFNLLVMELMLNENSNL